MTSNVEIMIKKDEKEEYRPIGERYRKFETIQYACDLVNDTEEGS